MSFNIIQPSLIQQLKTILDQYPDDGQILKELIQNAEDAGASEVKFLHDKHSYGTEKLHSKGLAQFQGPAIYAYNNAEFTSDDWEGIRMLCDSKKIKDPMKVGRFGLGFKSVFHVTDLPSIISNSQIGIIDPHEQCFGDRTTGYSWQMKEGRAAMNKIPDQFAPYKGVFDCTDEVFSEGWYSGTLFRFPLRTRRSKLSQTLYSAEKVHTLFEGFMADAHLVLLFLQHLESIELHVREESDTEPRKTFQVRITDESLQLVQGKRKEFQSKISTGQLTSHPVDVTYPITIEAVDFQGMTTSTCRHSFLVTNYFCGGEVSSEFRTLATDKSLSYLPLVGVAMALPASTKEVTPAVQGHVFCFLPLPVQKTSLTGLPVHVNGFFALSQNRRYIKSPNAEQEDQEKAGHQLTDKSLLWNKCLQEEAIPKAYATMILTAINEKSYNVQAEAIYKAWPDVKRIDQKWERIARPLFQLLVDKKIVYTEANGGKWLTVGKAFFNQLPENQTKRLLQRVLLAGNLPIVSVPRHVTEAIVSCTGFNEITPLITRLVLKKAPTCYKKRDRREKLLLLHFCLQDCHFDELCDLELLPLSNGTFTTFSNRSDRIYICSPEHPRELLPGLQHRFLDDTVDEDIIGKLKVAAQQECTQLRLLSKDDVTVLLRQALPSEWGKGETVKWYPDDRNYNHPPKGWIDLVWRYLRDYFCTTEELHRLGNLPLIPLNMSVTPVTMVRICHPSRVIVKRLKEECIDDALTSVLTKLDVIVLDNYPTCIRYHPAVLGTFVNPPSAQGVLRSMVTSASKMAAGTFSETVRMKVSTKEMQVLRSFLATVRSTSLGTNEYSLLCSLPVFQTLSKKFVSKKDVKCAAPVDALPISPLRDLIDLSHNDSKTLALLLEIRILTPTELLCEVIFSDIKLGKYRDDQIDKLMPYVLKRFTHVIRTDVYLKRNIQALSFVPKQRERVKASDLFDPRNDTLKKIFGMENVFPVGEQYNDSTVLVMLEELGMKTESNIAGRDLLQSAKLVSVLPHLPTARKKSNAILQYFSIHPQKLNETINGQQLGSLLKDIRWVSRLWQETSNFPPSLPWWKMDEEEVHFFKPSEIKSRKLINLIGTVKPVVDEEPSDHISMYFGWQNEPDVFDVVRQLQNVITCYSKDEKPYYMVLVNEIYSFLSGANYGTLNQAFHWAEIVDWVWNGDGFSSPKHVLSSKPPIDLTPYILPLPSEMKKYLDFFHRFGVRKQADPSLLLQVLGMIEEKHDEQKSRFDAFEVRHDLQLSVDILNEVAGEKLSPEDQAKILLPVHHVEEAAYVLLRPVDRCMYCEHKEWLREEDDDEDMEDRYFYVHSNVPIITAKRLGVPSQKYRMVDAEDLFEGEEFGQEEKLTTRLNRLLEDYKDGFAVLKELVQNADDAGATEVRFLYDERTNEDSMTCLIDEGMRGCQGPALWVYNDATFKDEDFVNITKLNEATKAHDTEKIGRFGLGFNAVYNLTDVPMFVSKNYFAIFDPHESHLGKRGIKLDVNKNAKRLKNQFKPFNGIFGCNLLPEGEDNSFDGTLFRFPLRTREQAPISEIKKLCYDDQEMRELLKMFVDRAKSLLLFTQNVFRVGIYNLPRAASQNPQPVLMFHVTKSFSGILRELSVPITLPVTAKKLDADQRKLLEQCNFLQASSKVTRDVKNHKIKPSEFPGSSIAVSVECSFTNSGAHFFKIEKRLRQESETWLVVSSMGNGNALQFAKSDRSLLPSAGVAVQLVSTESDTFLPSPGVDGTIFCYLPLPIHSGLPVHINGAFAVSSNRRHLQGKLEDDKMCFEDEWNKVLMRDSISTAYLCLLEDVKNVVPDDGSYVFHSLWPLASQVRPDCWSILTSFYDQLAGGSHTLFSDGNEWVAATQVVFLHPDLRMDPEIGEISFAVFQVFAKENGVVIDLPAKVFQSFVRCGLWRVIKNKTYDKIRFFSDVFFPNVSNVHSDFRDALVLNALNYNHKEFDELIKKNTCIPASPGGKTLKRPSQLVHPNKDAAPLFCPDDGRFPLGNENTFCNPHLLTKLEELGMKSNDLPWEDIADRAESIRQVNSVDSKAAVKRVKVLLEFVQKKMKRKGNSPSNVVLSRLLEADFLPVLQKPTPFPLPWKSEEFRSPRRLLAAPKDIFLKEKKYLVCCSELLVDLDIPKKVTKLLKLQDKNVTTDHVLKQLEEAISINIAALDRKGYEEVIRVCTETYSFLQDNIANCTSSVKQFLLTKRFILVGKRFLSANRVAFENNTDCFPYLYELPDDLSDAFSKLMKFSGVRKHFEEKDYISSLQDVNGQFDKVRLDERTLQVAVNMAIQLGGTFERSNSDPCKVQEKWGPIYLPDSREIMRPVPDLCYKDCPWMPDDPDEQFVHEKIPWSTCEHLGVKTRRDDALQHHEDGFPFGQKEELTNRLKRILTGYPGEKEILKELLQNADDAQATEISFIKDPRHHPDERVFRESWKPLQGPALCVYNNRPFTNMDIEGICNLGKGSKGEDPNKTGQYGIGFNAVYHLTDVPSFMSKGEEIGDLLCVFDPHCKYVRYASEQKPGRMFKGIEKLKTKFADVFPCYLEEHFPIKNATMFRFPLKSEKMAEESKISRTPVTVEKLDAMLEDLKQELFEVLLFVNNVKKIGISAIEENGKLVNTYSVEVVMSQEDDRARQAFAQYIKEIGNQAKQNAFVPTSIKVRTCTYTLRLRDSCGMEEKWLIVQQVGFKKPAEKSIVDAFKDHQLGMLPRGGVACLLQSNRLRSPVQEKKKAYCFLPLPFETNLPVHINGHFALDHEARRNLWRDEAGGYRSDWNNALLRDVIASCYLTLLDKVRGFLQLPVLQDGIFSRNTILMGLKYYEKLFPSYPFDDPHWSTLADSVYQEMSMKEMRLIPVLRSFEGSSSGRMHAKDLKGCEGVRVTWFPPTGTDINKTFFNNLEMKGCFAALAPRRDMDEEERKRREESRIKRKNKFIETMLETGLNLVALSITVFDSFREAGVEVCCVSPSAVMDFFKSFSDPDPLCKIGNIPCPVDKTAFRDQKGVLGVLKYCRDDEQFVKNLPGLPLLLTQDNYVRAFSERSPRCLSQYTDILPHSPSLFVHVKLRMEVFYGDDCKNASVFRPLDVDIFASQLHQTLPLCFRRNDQLVRWSPDTLAPTLPNRRWIYRVWEFLQEFASDTMPKSDVSEEMKIPFIRELLSPLSNWSILPATETIHLERPQTPCCFTTFHDKQTVANHFLVPLNMAESVLDFTDCGLSSQKLVGALRHLGLPELNAVVMRTMSIDTVSYTKMDSYKFARNLVATIKTPHSLLVALKRKLEINRLSLDGKLKYSEAIVVLDYFSRNTKCLTDEDKGTLKRLPFFPKASGGLGRLEEREGFVLPGEIPDDGMDVIESRLQCSFLESREILSDLYEFLEFEHVLPAQVYLKFVLKCFQHLSFEGRLAHLKYLRDFIFSTSAQEKENEELDKKRLLDHLKMVEFIPTLEGPLKTASSFYDPANDVFRAMLSEERFPPKPFNSYEWLQFLKEIGLVKDVSQDDFLKFVVQVAREAETARTEDTHMKSEVLVHHLFSRPNVVGEGLLHIVRDIPFVVARPVTTSLQALCPPFGETKDEEIPFIAFKDAVVSDYEEIVWTKAHLLPTWADPRCNRYELANGCPHRKIDQYLNSFICQLQILTKPSVDLVVSHCQTVSMRRNVPSEQCSTVKMVMEHIYTFLQGNAMNDRDAKMRLQTTRCILVDGGKSFILPRQVVLELYEALEIKPYLYRVPPEFGKFQALFEFLGCSKTVNCTHYALVLEMLQKICKDAKLHPNEVDTCSKAVRGFFDSLQEDTGAVSNLSELYLPAMSPGGGFSNTLLEKNAIPVTLHQSTELVFDDAPTYSNRIQGLNQRFVLKLSLMKVTCKSTMVNYEDLMMKLPLALRPRMLSSVVKEKLSDPENTKIMSSGTVIVLKQQLSSVPFCRGIARIIRHVNCQTKGFDERVITSIEKKLRSIQLFAVERLSTTLFHDDILLPGSECDVPCFQQKLETSGEEIRRVYINTTPGMDDTISTTSLVTNVIVEMYGEYLGTKAFVISEMVRCPPSRIWSMLDRMRIRKDDSYNAAEMDIYPEPGTLIPIEDHHLLNEAFKEFETGEYVGYQLDDPSLDLKEGAATYIYAIIVEQVTNEDAGVLTKEYRINIGHDKEPVVVNAARLQKFHRLNEIFDDQDDCHRNREEVLKEISDVLEKAWELPDDQEEERVQIVKRLFMRWFPKENVANNELYNAASQHIKNEVSRLGGSYDELFSVWEARAKEHGSQRETYRKRFCHQYGPWQSSSSSHRSWHVPPSFCTSNPQPQEAKRWFRQAEADIEAGAKEIDFSNHSYEWACFKCHQAAEKALKAVQYDIDANQKTNDHNLQHNCFGFNDPELTDLAIQLEGLVVHSAHMRYPDTMSYPKIPNDVYTEKKAEKALMIAKKILDRVRCKLN